MMCDRKEIIECGIYIYSSTLDDIELAVQSGVDRGLAQHKAAAILTSYTVIAADALRLRGHDECTKLTVEIADAYEIRCAMLRAGTKQ